MTYTLWHLQDENLSHFVQKEEDMRVFIAGAKAIRSLDARSMQRLETICKNEYEILVGDCYGVDSEVQKFCVNFPYNKVLVFASNGKARNNLGGWNIQNIPVAKNIKGFEFYRKKDIAMAEAADYGFMIWDGKSKGTYQNIVTLLGLNKQVLVYIKPKGIMHWFKTLNDLAATISFIQSTPSEVQLSLY